MKCKKCKQEIPDNSIFCLYCGKKQITTSKKPVRRRKGQGSIILRSDLSSKKYEAQYKGNYVGCFSSYDEADEAIAKFRVAAIAKNDYYNYSVEKVYNHWKAETFDNLTYDVQKKYDSVFKNYFSDIKSMKMRDIKTLHLQKIVDHAAALYGYDICAKIRTVARGICEQAMKNDIINKNYGALLSLPAKKKPEKHIFSKEQIKLLWKHKKNSDVQLILILIYTGIRPGELFSTEIKNIYLDQKYFITGIKTEAGKNRPVPIADCILPFFRDVYNRTCERGKSRLLQGEITQDRWSKEQFYPALKMCGIIEDTDDHTYTPYSCRHTFFSMQKQLKTDPALLTAMFGHADEEVGNRNYYHPQIEEKLEAVNKIQAYIS